MANLLTPPAGDPRSPEEYTYDMQRDGTLYTAQPAQPERSPLFYELKDWIDSHFDADEPEGAAQPAPIDAMLAEVKRRMADPTREPFVLRTHPLAPDAVEDTKALFRALSDAHQERLLNIFEQIVILPEPEQSRAFDFMLVAFAVVEEMAA